MADAAPQRLGREEALALIENMGSRIRNMGGARLKGADLAGANLSNANLTGANL